MSFLKFSLKLSSGFSTSLWSCWWNKNKEEKTIMRSQAVIPSSFAEQSSGQRGSNTHTIAKGNVIQQYFSSPRELWVELLQKLALHRTALLREYHNITKCLRLEGTTRGLLAQPPCSGRVTQSTLSRFVCRQLLNISREEHSTTSLGILSQCSVTLTVKGILPHVHVELLVV